MKNIKQYMTYPSLSREEEQKLLEDYKLNKNVASKHKLVMHHMKMVVARAHASKKRTGTRRSLDEIMSDGTEGLIYAVDKFDLTKKSDFTGSAVRFSTFAHWYIRVWILHGIMTEHSSVYRVGTGKLKAVFQKLPKIMAELGLSTSTPLTYSNAIRVAQAIGGRCSPEDVIAMERIRSSESSLDAPTRDGRAAGDSLPGDPLDLDKQIDVARAKAAVARTCAELGEDSDVATAIYVRGMTPAEAAAELGVDLSRAKRVASQSGRAWCTVLNQAKRELRR